MFRTVILAAAIVTILTACSEPENSRNISVSQQSAPAFDSAKLAQYTSKELSKFYAEGVAEAELKRCARSLSKELESSTADWVSWCESAADEGLDYAYMPLAREYQSRDDDEATKMALSYYLKAGEAGVKGANYEAAKIYLNGPIGIADYAKATELSEKMLRGDDPLGAAILARLAFNGLIEGADAATCLGFANYGKEKFLAQNMISDDDYNADLAEFNFLIRTCTNGLSSEQILQARNVQDAAEQEYRR